MKLRPEYRLIAVMHDGTTVSRDFTPKPTGPQDKIFWFDSYKTVQMADLVISIHLDSGHTEVLKNRWGDTGDVYRG